LQKSPFFPGYKNISAMAGRTLSTDAQCFGVVERWFADVLAE
jgi:hypothetical protein